MNRYCIRLYHAATCINVMNKNEPFSLLGFPRVLPMSYCCAKINCLASAISAPVKPLDTGRHLLDSKEVTHCYLIQSTGLQHRGSLCTLWRFIGLSGPMAAQSGYTGLWYTHRLVLYPFSIIWPWACTISVHKKYCVNLPLRIHTSSFVWSQRLTSELSAMNHNVYSDYSWPHSRTL